MLEPGFFWDYLFKFNEILLYLSIKVTQRDIGKKIVEIRNAKGLTQADLAKKCKITTRTVQRIEAGSVAPRAYTIQLISQALEFNFSENQELSSGKNQSNVVLKNLFNLKSNLMKKVSVLAIAFLLITIFFVNIFKIDAQSNSVTETKNLKIELNEDKSISKIQAYFTNDLSLDELTEVKNKLAENGISIFYRNLEFDENGGLLGISCDVDCTDGFKGSFSIGMLNSVNKNKRIGFVRNYSSDTKTPFCTGGCNL